MKITSITIKRTCTLLIAAFLWYGCQDMDTPELGDYPQDANAPGGPLNFYVAFDGTSSDPLMNAVDSIRAKFPTENPLQSVEGISGKAINGNVPKKFVSYSKPNDWAAKAESFTISFWAKHGAPTQTEFPFSLVSDNWALASMFCLVEGTVEKPVVKLFIDEQPGDKWFEWLNDDSVPGLFDGQWYHLVFVYDATTSGMTLYKDGVAYATKFWDNHGPIKLKDNKVTGFRIGGSGNPDEGWMNSWTGDLDQFRLYSKALTVAEINDLYTNKK
jgi:hypothetical protein